MGLFDPSKLQQNPYAQKATPQMPQYPNYQQPGQQQQPYQQPGLSKVPLSQPPQASQYQIPKPGGDGNAAYAAEADLGNKRRQLIDAVDIMSQDISMNSEETINKMIDFKVKLSSDKVEMEEALEQCQEGI